MPHPVANALVLRSQEGGSMTFAPTPDGRLQFDVASLGTGGHPTILQNNLDRAAVAMIRDFLSGWLDGKG